MSKPTTSSDSANPIDIAQVRAGAPGLIAALGFFVPGLGQICCAQDNKGVFLLGMAVLGHWLTGGISTLLLCPMSGLDAFMVARKIRNGSAIRKWAFYPGLGLFDRLPPRVIPMVVVCVILAITVIRIVIYAQGYNPEA